MVIASNEQLDCRHIVGVTTRNGVAHLVYHQVILDSLGGISFTYCPMCGAIIKEEEANADAA
jgi:hypothetical protein